MNIPGLVKTGRLWGWRGLIGVLGLGLLLWYAATVPAIVARDRQITLAGTGGGADPTAEDVALLTALTGPTDFVLVDEPYLAYLSRRRVPPSLVDPTVFRLRSGTLSGSEVIEAAARFNVRAMLLWSDGLRDLKKFGDWVDGTYRPVKIWERRNGKDRALYLRNDADLASARLLLTPGLAQQPAQNFADQLRLTAWGLDGSEVRPGGSVAVTSVWEAATDLQVDYHVLAILSGPDEQVIGQIERSLGGGGAGTASWEAGRWTVRTFALTIPPRTPPGDYLVSLALYDSKARQRLPLASPGRAPEPAGRPAKRDETPVGTIRVR